MKIKTSRKTLLTLESFAITDIILNMFIFFFTSFSLLYTFNPYKESKIKVNLPRGITEVQVKGESPLVVSVTAENEIYIGKNKISPESLLKELASYSQTAKQNGLVVKSDKRASVDFFVQVLDAAKQAGIDKLGVSIELRGKSQ